MSNVTRFISYTTEGNISTEEKALLAWCSVVLVLSLTGNSYVLYSTISHRAIKLDKMSVWIIQNLAVTDIANSVLVMIPITVTIANGYQWKLGRGLCVAVAQYHLVLLLANGFYLNALSLNKLVRCSFPLRMMNSTQKHRLCVTFCVVILSFIPSFWTVYGVRSKIFEVSKYFLHLNGICNIAFNETETPPWVMIITYIVYILFTAGPVICLIITNVALLVLTTRKTNTTINKANVLIVVATTSAFVVCVLPRGVDYLSPVYLGRLFDGFAWYILFFMSWINPFIYLATNQHYRDFTVRNLMKISSSFRSTKRSDVLFLSAH